MGPRVFARGDTKGASGNESTIPASMGPRVFARGDDRTLSRAVSRSLASMGPRVFARGDLSALVQNKVTALCFNGATRVRAWR